MLQGPDVSSYQGFPDWNAVAASGRAFGWCKATEGTSYVNPTFDYNWPRMKAAGLVRGTYHFGTPSGLVTPEADCDAFLRKVQPVLEPGDLVALDLETGNGNLLAWALRWLRHAEQQLGFKPMLYSGNWFLGPHDIYGSDELATFGLWLSGYAAYTPPLPAGWTVLAMWQYTDADFVPGIAGQVDESYFFGDLAALRSYGMPEPSYGPNNSPVPPTVNDQVVTILSVIGDMTYPDGVDMDAPAPNQPVSRRVFQRQLVQHGKALLGA